jgi:hypothetical protein
LTLSYLNLICYISNSGKDKECPMAIDPGVVRTEVLTNGPRRVMIDEYEAVRPQRAELDHNIKPVVVFIRNDGWTLGAPAHLEGAAQSLWSGDWIAVLRNPPEWEMELIAK